MDRLLRSTSLPRMFSVAALSMGMLMATTGCPSVPKAGEFVEASPTGAKLFTRITQDNPYQDWAQFSDYEGTRPSALPHGPMSRVFINSEVESALDTFSGSLPNGSIIVKENVGTSAEVTEATLTVMWKVQGFDPDNNDWFWANMTEEGQVAAEGKIQGCAACHGGARTNDFVFVHAF